MTVVALDAMGGDRAPSAIVEGALLAARAGTEIALVGDTAVLERELKSLGGAPPGVRCVHAPDAIAMSEHAALEIRSRRESSIYIGLSLVKSGEADAFVSAGNTGAVLASSLVVLGRLPGVERPALAALLPLRTGPTLLLDAGANVERRASHLVQFALLGATYMRLVLDNANPRVALLNVGEEGSKGPTATIEAYEALQSSSLRFVGNVEGRDLVLGAADVVVTDGFTGNVALKLAEGMTTMMFAEFRETARSSWRTRVGGLLLTPALQQVRTRLDYRRYGGAPLLGVGGTVFVGHGSSDAEAVENAIGSAADAAARGLTAALTKAVRPSPDSPGQPGSPKQAVS